MSRAGRKRMIGEREPNGKMSRAVKRDIDGVSPAEAARLRDAALRGMRDQVWATPLGQAFATGAVCASEFEAGKRWCNLYRLFKAATGNKDAASASLERGAISTSGEQDEKQAERERATVDAYNSARHRLSACGSAIERATREFCEDNGASPPGIVAFANAIRGLSVLANHWGLTE